MEILGLNYFMPSDVIGLTQKLRVKMKMAQELLGELSMLGSLLEEAQILRFDQTDANIFDKTEKYKLQVKREAVKVSRMLDSIEKDLKVSEVDIFDQIENARKAVNKFVKFLDRTNDAIHESGLDEVLRSYDSMPDLLTGPPLPANTSAIDTLIRVKMQEGANFFGAWARHMKTTFG